MTGRRVEALLWSIALPGFGQMINGQYAKGILFLGLEIIINLQSNFNDVILLSFQGQTDKAIGHMDAHWLLFYPCLYMYALWDAYKHAGDGDSHSHSRYAYLPFAVSAFFTTVGLIYSPDVTLFGSVMGPVWFPILCSIVGFGAGLLLRGVLD